MSLRDSCDYTLLDLTVVQKRLACPPEQECTQPESGTTRTLYDCPEVPLTPGGPALASGCSNPSGSLLFPIRRGAARGDDLRTVCLTLASPAFTAKDVLDLYLHRGYARNGSRG